MHPQVVQDHPGTCPICHMRLTPMRAGREAGGTARGGSPTVVIDPAVVQNMGVRTAEVVRGPIVRTVRTVGVLREPEPGLHDISPKVGGWIEKLYANQEGMHVRKGDPLFDLYSPDLLVAEEELVGAARALRNLGPDAAESVRRDTEGLVASAKRKLRLLDVSDADANAVAETLTTPRTVTFRSPSDGAVVEKAVVEGSSVQPGMKLMRIEDHTTLWLDVQVYEDQMPLVAIGQPVDATLEALPGETFHGTVSFIYPHVDHMSRTVTARATLDNPAMRLRPGMYATATIHARPVADAVQVPREAVIDTGTRQIAFVARMDGHFEPRAVRTGVTGDDGRVQVLDGLTPGEAVVTSGQFLLDVESRTTEAIEKLRGGTSAPAMAAAATGATTAPAATGPATRRAEVREVGTLFLAHCPMKDADWLQEGEQLANPYYGPAMLDCGEFRRKVAAPPGGSPLSPVVAAYLRVGKGLASDRLDADAVESLRAAADRLPGPDRAGLRQAVAKLAAAPDLNAARAVFGPLSDELARAVEAPPATGPSVPPSTGGASE